jgi:predicted nucleic acid-binding protein
MSGDFLDTNVFIYRFDRTDERKRSVATRLLADALAGQRAAISYQVVQEALYALTSKIPSPLSDSEADDFLQRVLLPLWTVMPSASLFERAMRIRRRYQLHFYDALVVAGALQAGCDRLLSEDLQHGETFDGLRVENPFLA